MTEHATEGSRVAAFFDLDKTVIAKSSTLAFSRPFFQEGLINRRAVLKSAYAQFVFMLAGADADQMDRMRSHITALCEGWDVEQVRSIVEETLHDIVDPLVYAEATELVADHKEEGRDIVVVSASGAEIVTPISEMIGATQGLGFLITYSQMNFLIPQMYAAILTTSVVGLAVNHGLVSIERHFSRWRA